MRVLHWLSGRSGRGSFVRAVGTLVAGTGFAQALSFLAAPALTRLYAPEHFGVAGVFVSLANLLVAVAALGYELAIPLPKRHKRAADVLAVALALLLATTTAIALGLIWAGDSLVRLLNAPGLGPHLWLLPLAVLFLGTYRIVTFWGLRLQSYRSVAAARVRQGLGKLGTQLGLGVVHVSALGLLLGEVAGYLLAAAGLVTMLLRRSRDALRSVTRRGMRRALVRHRRFPLLASGSRLLNAGGIFLPVLLVAATFEAEIAGWFSLSLQVVGIPAGLFGRSVYQAFTAKVSQLAREDPAAVRPLFFRTLGGMALLGLLPTAILALFGPQLFSFVFGESWTQAGVYCRLLALMFLAQFSVEPLAYTLNLFSRQDLQLVWEIVRMILILATLVGLPLLLATSATTTIGVYSAAMTVAYGVLLLIYVVQLARNLPAGS